MSWQTTPMFIVVEVAGGVSVINLATLFSFYQCENIIIYTGRVGHMVCFQMTMKFQKKAGKENNHAVVIEVTLT